MWFSRSGSHTDCGADLEINPVSVMVSEAIDINIHLVSPNFFCNQRPSEIIKLENLIGASIPNLPRSFQTEHWLRWHPVTTKGYSATGDTLIKLNYIFLKSSLWYSVVNFRKANSSDTDAKDMGDFNCFETFCVLPKLC